MIALWWLAAPEIIIAVVGVGAIAATFIALMVLAFKRR